MNNYINNKNKFKISTDDLICFVFWLSFFTPPFLERISATLGKIGDLLSLISSLLYVFLNFNGRIVIRKSHIFVSILLSWSIFCVAFSSISSLPYFLWVVLLPVIEVIVILEVSVRKRGYDALKPLYYVSCIYLFLNFISMLLFPTGMFLSSEGSSVVRAQWILGSKNNIPLYVVLFITVIEAYNTITYSVNNKKTFCFWSFLFMAVYSVLFSGGYNTGFFEGSSTGILAILVCTIVYVYINITNNRVYLLSVLNIIIIAGAVNLFLLGGFTSSFVNHLIKELFGKSPTFSGRTNIWNANIPYIKNSPIIGYGMNTFDANVYIDGVLSTTAYTYNMFLKYMLSYGVVFIILLFITLLSIKTEKNMAVDILLVGFLGVVIIGTMNEVSLVNLLFFPLIVSAIDIIQYTSNKPESYLKLMEYRRKNTTESDL